MFFLYTDHTRWGGKRGEGREKESADVLVQVMKVSHNVSDYSSVNTLITYQGLITYRQALLELLRAREGILRIYFVR